MKQKEIKKLRNKGITLIALVITIIVLLILAGVSIAMLTGENGILTQAQNASKQTEIGEEKEQIALAYNGAVTKKQSTDITADDLNEQFNANGVDNATASGENPITVTFDSGRTYTIDENGNISAPTESNIVATMSIEGEKSTAEPTMPTGFSYVEGTVDNGYVIQDTSGNQYVWVPVDKNQKIKINVTSKEDIESITLTDPVGTNSLTVNNDEVGTTYTNENVEPTINGPYVLKVTTASEEKSFVLGVHSLYAVDTFKDWTYVEPTDEELKEMEAEIDKQIEVMEQVATDAGYSTVEDYFNKEVLQGEITLEEMGFTTIKDYAMATMIPSLTDPFMKAYLETEDYTESVNNNGGFYIGRYEASKEGENVAVKGNVKPWNRIKYSIALGKAQNMYSSLSEKNFTSSLLTGAAWDRTLGWLEETGQVTSSEIVGDSKTWGNYNDDEFSNTTGIANTGEFSQTEKNHIYDLAGNLEEWTTERDSANPVTRGGDYIQHGSVYPSSHRIGSNPSFQYPSVGFRLALFL